MRTSDEIVNRINELEHDDFFGFQRSDLIPFLPFEHAKSFLKEDVTADDWKPKSAPTKEAVKADIIAYLPFAWKKANDCRWLSAVRSLDHMKAWLWLYDQSVYDAFAPKLEDCDCYGKHQLAAISEYFGFPWREHDDDIWCNEEDGPHQGVNDDFSWLPSREEARGEQ